jgi:hypothetical protein
MLLLLEELIFEADIIQAYSTSLSHSYAARCYEHRPLGLGACLAIRPWHTGRLFGSWPRHLPFFLL